MSSTLSILEQIQKNNDVSVQLGHVTGMETKFVHGFVPEVNTSPTTIAEGLNAGENLVLPSSPITMAIASTNVSDNQTIAIYYFADNTTTVPALQLVVLNGQTKVQITNDIYRIERIMVASNSQPQGTIYIGANTDTFLLGKPTTNIYYCMVGGTGQSSAAMVYVPTGKKCLIKASAVTTDIDNTGDVLMLEGIAVKDTLLNVNYKVHYHISHGGNTSNNSFREIPSGTTFYFQAYRVDGSGNHSMSLMLSYILADV